MVIKVSVMEFFAGRRSDVKLEKKKKNWCVVEFSQKGHCYTTYQGGEEMRKLAVEKQRGFWARVF